MMLTVGSLFSGVGGFDLGFERAGMRVLWQVESDPKAQRVLRERFPDVEVVYSNVKTVDRHLLAPVDVICGGFPCQDVSVAGRRGGLDGERSGLWFEYHRILREMRPEWCVIENVPGLLSSCGCPTCGAMRRLLRIHAYLRQKRKIDQPCALCRAAGRLLASHRGRDFAVILRGLVELGYGVSWRILDAQHFGVPQRRRRIFIVGHLGDGRAAEVLFEAESVLGHPPPRRQAGQSVAASLTRGSGVGSNDPGRRREDDVNLVVGTLAARDHKGVGSQYVSEGEVIAQTLTAHEAKGGDPTTDNYVIAAPLVDAGKRQWSMDSPNFVTHALTGEGFDASEDGTGRGTPITVIPIQNDAYTRSGIASPGVKSPAAGIGTLGDAMYTLDASREHAIAFAQNQRGELRTMDVAAQLTTGGGKPGEGYPAVMLPVGVDGTDTAYALRANPSHSGDKGDGGVNTTKVAHAMNSQLDSVEEGVPPLRAEPGGLGYPMSQGMAVRRLMPVECERLQGFPDGWTDVPGSSDSTRYRQMGNAVAVPVAEWIARRLQQSVLPLGA